MVDYRAKFRRDLDVRMRKYGRDFLARHCGRIGRVTGLSSRVICGFKPRQCYMLKTINAEAGGVVYVFKNEPDIGGEPDKVCVMHELVTPVSLTEEETDELILAIQEVKAS